MMMTMMMLTERPVVPVTLWEMKDCYEHAKENLHPPGTDAGSEGIISFFWDDGQVAFLTPPPSTQRGRWWNRGC